jgi:hypothetical protein
MNAETISPRFSTDAIAETSSSGISAPVEFRGNPSLYAKKLTAVGVVVLIAIAAMGWFQLEERNPKFYLFASGMTLAVLVGRYFSLMGISGPPALVFDVKGITIRKGKKTTEVAWSDLRSVRNEVVRGGQLWEIAWMGGKFDYFIDGLTSLRKAELKKTIGSIKLPHVQVRLEHYDTV